MATKTYSLRKRKQIYVDDNRTRPKKRPYYMLLPYLPTGILMNIIAKLPSKSILRCKRVCKEWRDMIEDPHFAELHYDSSRIAHVKITRKTDIVLTESYRGVNERNFEASSLKMKACFGEDVRVVNSCRGFLLIQDCKALYICNPLTKECKTLTSLQGHPIATEDLVCGLGFGSSTKQYKVVVFPKERDRNNDVQVNKIGSNEWRKIEGKDRILDKIQTENNNTLALNGNIHWLATGEKIGRFDVDKEEFSPLDSPRIGDYNKYVISIGILQGCLCVHIIDNGNLWHGVESWIMKQYGNPESWTLYCVVERLELMITQKGVANYKILETLDNGNTIVVETPSGTLTCYDLSSLQERSAIHSGYNQMEALRGAQLHFPGFFPFVSTGTNV